MLVSRVDGSIAGSDWRRWISSSCKHQQTPVFQNPLLQNQVSVHSSCGLHPSSVPKTLGLTSWFHVRSKVLMAVLLKTGTVSLSV
jgi:hypothetical protein